MAVEDLQIDHIRRVPGGALSVKTSRSSGPGGQHVNKTESRVTLELNISKLEGIWSAGDYAQVRQRLAAQLTNDDRFLVHVDTYRHQSRNLDEAKARMRSVLRAALFRPKNRLATKPTRGSQRRRVDAKRRLGEKKRMRSKAGIE